MLKNTAAALAVLLLVAVPALAQAPPAGAPVLNQAGTARVLTPNDTTNFTPTRGLHIGDGTACDVSVIFTGDTDPVTLPNMQPGLSYPYSIKRLRATGTTCTSVTGLR